MAFNFASFLQALTQMLPAIGQAVETLHQGDQNEALKISVGTAMVSSVAQALQESTQTPTTLPPAP